MTARILKVGKGGALYLFLLLGGLGHGLAQESRLARPIDPGEKVVLGRTLHPWALTGKDQGKIPDEQTLSGIVLEFRRTPEQQAALSQLLSTQQDSKSAEYHHWLTPEQFADRFGISQADMDATRQWLEGEGFQVDESGRSRTYIRFSGTARQVRRSFSADIHNFMVNGERQFAPATAITVPAALAPLVRVVRNLDSFRPKAPRPVTNPLYVYSGGNDEALAPGDLAVIYDFQSLRAQGYDGTGQSIAVVGQTDISLNDLAFYRQSFGLPAANVTIFTAGSDPGVSPDDVIESDLDLDVVSAVVPNASIVFVNAISVLDAVEYAIDNNLAPVISMSYGGCEPLLSAFPGADPQLLQSWAQQANAQGITWLAASGDSGAGACDPFAVSDAATSGPAVELPASIPEVTGVGGTQFQGPGLYWGVTNRADGGTAVSYVPEVAWPGSGGGASIIFPKPSWQRGPGVPNDGARDVPDVAFAASLFDGYIIALNGQLSISSGQVGPVGGTSAGTPLFAGIVVLLNQYLAPLLDGGQGNINPLLYSLGANASNVFHDIVEGDNLRSCIPGTPACVNGELGYVATPGYDQVTGLGSVDAYNLIHSWPSPAGQAPIVETDSAMLTSPPGSGATLAGTANPNGLDTQAYFLYGLSPFLSGATQTPSVDVGAGTVSGVFTAALSGLTANKTYYFQLVATNSKGTSSGSIMSFVPAGVLPSVTTLSAFGVSATGVVLSGVLNPNSSPTQYWFSYGTSSTLSSSTPTSTLDAGSGGAVVPATASLTLLAPNTTYYFRLNASNSTGTVGGSILSFTTNSKGQPPGVETDSANTITATSAALTGLVAPYGLDTQYWFVYSSFDANGIHGQTNPLDAGSGQGVGTASATLTGLSPSTIYTYQIFASNSAGVSSGLLGSFMTAAADQPGLVVTGGVSNITSSGATLAGSVNPNGRSTRYWFIYSQNPTLQYASQTSIVNLGSGTTPVPVSATISGLLPGTYYYQLRTSGSGGAAGGSILSFFVPGPPVGITLYAACDLFGCGFNGQLSPRQDPTQYWFDYGTSPTLSGASQTSTQIAYFSTAETLLGAFVPDGFNPGTTYYYQFHASNQRGTTSGQILSFVANLPQVVTSPATTGASNGEWTLWANAAGNNLPTQCWFAYGTNPNLTGALQTEIVYNQNTWTSVPCSRTVDGLLNNTTYYFQAFLSNAAGTVKGSILSFTTPNGPPQPSVTLNPVPVWNGTTATFTGTVNPNSLDTQYAFYALPNTPLSAALGSGDVGAGTAPVSVSASWRGVSPGDVNTIQLRATNSASGIGSSPVITFVMPGACQFSFPEGVAFWQPADALPSSMLVDVAPDGCAWNAVSDQGWLTLTNGDSTGYGRLYYTLALNNTGAARTAHITVGGQTITVTQNFTSQQFADVPPTSGYFDAVNLMFLAGVTTGCVPSGDPSTRSFCPNDNVTRDQMAAFLVRAVTGTNTPAIYNPVPYFADVPATDPFFPHVQKMMELGITTGCYLGPPRLYCPSDTIPRWAMAMFLVRARLALHGATFTTAATPYFADVPTNVEGNGMPFPFIQRSYEEHITNGCGTNPLIYCPDELVTRWQMAMFIMRALFNETMILGPTAPLLTDVTPNTMAATMGSQITVTITGVNTSFQSGDTVSVPSGMLTVSNVVVNSAISISATLTTNGTTVAGPQALVVTSGGQNLTLPLAIKVGTY